MAMRYTVHQQAFRFGSIPQQGLAGSKVLFRVPRRIIALASSDDNGTIKPSSLEIESPLSEFPSERRTVRRTQAESTDWIASGLTRRFGLGAGLAWVGLLAFGVISEQIKTRNELYVEENGTRDVEELREVITSDGIRYTDLRIGGGASPLKGDLVLISLLGKVSGTEQTFVNTTAPGSRDIVLTFEVRPYVKGVSEGLEVAMESMKVGGKRKVVVPPHLGFGDEETDFMNGLVVAGNSTLEYIVELKRVSIPPS